VLPAEGLDPRLEMVVKTFTPIPDKAAVYVYRKNYSDVSPLYVNGQYIGSINSGKFIRVVVPEGKYEIFADSKGALRPRRLSIDLKAGNIYYVYDRINIYPTPWILPLIIRSLKSVKADKAQSAIYGYQLINDWHM
jgi:hypothetical protein